MNLLGALGTPMKITGLINILENVYEQNAVVHMMTDKEHFEDIFLYKNA
jgi:hypothetical protein